MNNIVISSREQRAERARRLCRQLACEVANFAPPGISTWQPAWEHVTNSTDVFLDLLAEWERTGDAELLPEMRTAYRAVLTAWKEAAGQYREATHA